MHFTKPAWVIHKDSARQDSTKRLSIFSIHVHPDGSRIATGGLDAKVRIWSTKPILNPAAEESGKPPKSLCTLTMHTGPVLTVRWAHSGRWLASGSDDEIVMIWDLDPNARGKVWGSDEVNVEGWKPLKRLVGHESGRCSCVEPPFLGSYSIVDVTDVAWAPEDRYLASVGLDSMVFIWCGYTLERLRKLDQHQGFVKGVCWDPVGEFLATQSDDRTVKIWRTTDWALEAEVKKPFEDSPGSTFFRRLSWSPDGAHITASNATNNRGFVFIAAVITRGAWTSDISLVGHENTIEVAAYNPHIFLRNPSAAVATSNICSVVALGADDRSVSVWQTKSARPLIVAKEVFERQIMDLSWSWDGMTLYAASSDGTIAVFHFEPDELEGIAPLSVQQQYLSKFGFVPPSLPANWSHAAQSQVQAQAQSQSTGFDGQANGEGERVNTLVAKKNKNKKKRLGLTQMGSVPSSAIAQIPSSSTAIPKSTVNIDTSNAFPTPEEQPFDLKPASSWGRRDRDFGMDMDVDMDMASSVPIDVISENKGKRKAEEELISGRQPTYRTLGGDRPRDTGPVRELSVAGPSSMGVVGAPLVNLPIPALLTRVTADVDGSEDVLEAINAEGEEDQHEVMLISGKSTKWLDYVPSPVLAVRATSTFCAAAMQDGSINVYSHTGRRLMPTLSLGSPCSLIDGNKHCLMVITQSGQLYSWKVNKNSAFFPPISVAPLISSPNYTITSALVRPNGCPIVNCSNGSVFSYDSQLSAWVKLSEKWWSEGSDAWQGRQRTSNTQNSRGIISTIENSVSSGPDEQVAGKARPNWWNTALTLGHLETRMHAARLLESPAEYKQALILYAKKIADEGFRAKAEELIKDLFGPVYWRPGEERENSWCPTVAGMAKRDLLKEVLGQFARSKTLTKLAMDWQDLLKKVANEE
ncbi:HIR complex subunit [Paramarasmius palmivorus]|uniref:Protein HIR n=1 Tax=Paramarasmius palmivorus TaxID=297713 RepID=A0AAW0CCB2_9AGAR